MKTDCPHRIQPALERRPANALNLEIGTPMVRCTLKPPEEWKGRACPGALRWLGSGGSPLIFGICSANCPREREMVGHNGGPPLIADDL